MKRTWYYRMLLSYLPIFFFISSFLFFVFFQELGEQSKKDAVKANQVLNLMVMDKVENALSTIDYALIDFSLNNKVLNQFFQETDKQNIVLNREMLKEVDAFKRQNPLVDSIYLVRLSDDIVLTERYMFLLDGFPDIAYIRDVEKTAGSMKWTSVRNYQEFEPSSAKHVVTLARSHFTALGERCIIVAQVKTTSIRSLVEQTYNEDINFVSISETDGKDILGNGSDTGGRKVLAERKSSYLGWTFRSGLVSGEFFNSVFELSRVWLLLGAITVILGLIAIIYVTGRNYRPLENVVSQIRALITDKVEQPTNRGANEFALIESAIEDMVKRSNKMDKQQEEGNILRKKHYFYEMIEGVGHFSEAEWAAEMGKYNLPGQLQGAQVLAMEIDNYAAFVRKFTKRDQFLLKYAIHNSATEMLLNHSLHSWSEWISDKRLICIIFQAEEAGAEHNHLACEELISWIAAHLPLTISVGMGAVVYRHDGVSESYNEALHALKFKFFKGLGTVIPLAETQIKQGGVLFSYLLPIRTLTHDFRIGAAGWGETFNQLFANFRSDFTSPDDIISLMDYLIFQLDRTIGELAVEYQEPWKENGMSSLTDVLDTAETLDDIQLRLFSILCDIGEMIRNAHEANNHHQLLVEVKGYIEANFTDPDMSLDRLKEQFGLNPKYLSQLFKEKFGEGFMDFLIRLRMERAKEMLRLKSDPVQSIAGKVGYQSVISFTRAFKKVTSLSPGDYRKQKEL